MLDYGIHGFLDQMQAAGIGADRIGEVRLADNRGVIEEHLYPGTGNLDFVGLFTTMEARGYRGHYMQDYTTIEDMLSGRDVIVGDDRAGAGAGGADHVILRCER